MYSYKVEPAVYMSTQRVNQVTRIDSKITKIGHDAPAILYLATSPYKD